MKPKLYPAAIIICCICSGLSAQTNTFPSTGAVGIGTTAPNASSLLEIKSMNKGILIPRLTKNQRDAIAVPATGLLIYQTNYSPGFYYYNGSAWTAVTTLGANLKLSNLAAPTAVNTDLLPDSTLRRSLGSAPKNWKRLYLSDAIYQFGQRVLLCDTINFNIWVGTQSGMSNKTGRHNTGIGYSTLYFNSAGNNNTANGYQALYSNSNGNHNVAVGTASLFLNTTLSDLVAVGDSSLYNNGTNVNASYEGTGNTGIGSKALYNNTRGAYNTGTGFQVLYFNTTGNANTANGYQAIKNNTTGYDNTANGYSALFDNTSGSDNTANGYDALNRNTTGFSNTANGSGALSGNTTGANNTATGDHALALNNTGNGNTANGVSALNQNRTGLDNTATGSSALFLNTEGSGNTADGTEAVESNTTGKGNTGVGKYALNGNKTGYYNAAVGYASLYGGTGNNNTALGSNADCGDGINNSTMLGNSAFATASNTVVVGNSNINVIGGQVNWSTFSDGRFKTNVKQNVPGLAFINKLRPVTYNLELKKIDKFLGRKDSVINSWQPQYEIGEKKIHTGFIAQEVEKAALEINYDFDGVNHPQNDKDNYSLSYAEFVVPLVEAVQELSKQNDSLKNENKDLEKRVTRLETLLNALSESSITNQQSSSISSASLSQNIPNPFSNSTTIDYTLPPRFLTAQLIITDKGGKVLKQINISGSGKGSLKIDGSTLASGAYNYSLYVDEKCIGSKQFVLAR